MDMHATPLRALLCTTALLLVFAFVLHSNAHAQVTIREHIVISPRSGQNPVALGDVYYESACFQRSVLSCYSNVMGDGSNMSFTVQAVSGAEFVRFLLKPPENAEDPGIEVGTSVTYDITQHHLYLAFDKGAPSYETLVHLTIVPANAPDNVSDEYISIIGNPPLTQGRTNTPAYVTRGSLTYISPFIYMECPSLTPKTDSLIATLVEGAEYGTLSNGITGSTESPLYLNWMSEGWYTWLVNLAESYEDVGFLANGAIPDVTGTVRVRFTSLRTSVDPWEATFGVVPLDSVAAQPVPAVAYGGDTVSFTLQNKKEILGGVLQGFPDSALFTVKILAGLDYGSVIAAGDTTLAGELHGVPKGFRLVTNNSFTDDSVMIGLLITADAIYPTDASLQGKAHSNVRSFPLTLKSKTSTTKAPVWLPKGKHATMAANSTAPLASVKGVPVKAKQDSLMFASRDQPNVWVTVRRNTTCVSVTIVPSVLFPGDTALVVINQVRQDGTQVPFPPAQLFDVSITGGDEFGTLLSTTGDTAASFTGVPQPIRFVEGNFIGVQSIITAAPSGQPNPLVHGGNRKTQSERIKKVLAKLADDEIEACGVPQATVRDHMDILLGQTKYVRAVYTRDGSQLKIQEVPLIGPNQEPTIENVWGLNPISALSGSKTGVYWEKIDHAGRALPEGYLRLIGRFWEKDVTYSVLLTASKDGKIVIDTVSVLKPGKLGSTRARAEDVNGKPYSVDSICISWGGLSGIPPQIIKAQYEKESVFEDGRYKPAYRYEPWTTQFDVRGRSDSPFWVSTTMGSGTGVPDHPNTRYMTYTLTKQTIWWFIEQYSTIVHDAAPRVRMFGTYDAATGILSFPAGNNNHYWVPTKEYDNIWNQIQVDMHVKPDSKPSDKMAARNVARSRFIDFMKEKYVHDPEDTPGLDHNPAQSRIASSYGPVQLLYTTALKRGYPNASDSPPEYLNVLQTFSDFVVKAYVKYGKLAVGKTTWTAGHWQRGFDDRLHRVLSLWNSDGYADVVVQLSDKYLPIPEAQ